MTLETLIARKVAIRVAPPTYARKIRHDLLCQWFADMVARPDLYRAAIAGAGEYRAFLERLWPLVLDYGRAETDDAQAAIDSQMYALGKPPVEAIGLLMDVYFVEGSEQAELWETCQGVLGHERANDSR